MHECLDDKYCQACMYKCRRSVIDVSCTSGPGLLEKQAYATFPQNDITLLIAHFATFSKCPVSGAKSALIFIANR